MNEFQLVDPEFLNYRLSEEDSDHPCILLDAHFTSIDHPSLPDPSPARHIPGAIQVHPSYLEAGTDRSKYYPHYKCPADGNLLPDNELLFYCGTGWRSSISFLVALLLGLKAKNYDDGFYGWSWHEENAIALGNGSSILLPE
ncbi:MAG: rhodanese-like domain-containing protein [Verrucomicrobia bacterium]|nr:rhodanese-like domain-containing protein [Verrucomicrobiota bacterium]